MVTLGSGSDIYLWFGANAGNTINVTGSSGGSNVYDSDTGDIVNVSGNGTNGAIDNINILSGTVNIAANSDVNVYGNSDAVVAGANVGIGVYGTGDTLTIGAGSAAYMGTNGGNTINVTGAGGSVVYDSSSTGDTVNISGNGEFGTDNYINLSNGTVVFQANASADIYGNNDAITAAATDLVGVHGTVIVRLRWATATIIGSTATTPSSIWVLQRTR